MENNEEELVVVSILPSDGSLRQLRVLGHSTSREDETFQEVEVGVDHSVEPKLSEDCRQIFEAVRLGDFQTLSILLTNYPTQFDTIEKEGNTALHCAVISACHKGDTHDSYYRCIDVLMNCQEIKINLPNKLGYTALWYALNDFQVKCVEHMLKHSSAHRLYLDYYPGDRESTVREIIMEKYPDLQPLLPAPLMESLDSSEIDIKLLTALQHGDYQTFCKNLDSTNYKSWYDEPYHSSLLEIACQMKNRKEFVERLLESGADPNIKNCVTGMPLLHATARSGNFEVLEMLLNKD
jgi:ankyrin repeat protein